MPDQVSTVERNIALALIALGVILRLWMPHPIDFWEDEVIAATHAMLPLWQVVVDTVRNDTHPPLYFVQLHMWGWLGGHSGFWFLLNSVVWSLVAIASLWWTIRRLYGARVGLFAAAIFAVLPAVAYNAGQLRMYSFLSTLLIWAFYLSVLVFGERRRGIGLVLALIALLIAIVNTHAIAAIAAFVNGIYALYLVRTEGRRGLGLWFLVYGAAALCAVPWLVTGMIHDANLHDVSGLIGFIDSVGSSAIGYVVYGSGLFALLGVLVFCLILALGLSSERTQPITLVYIVLPIIISVVVALALKPVFKWNFFSTLEAPFIALVVALVLDRPPMRYTRAVYAPLLVAMLIAANIGTRLLVHVTSGFRDRADLIAANYRPGDVVFVPQQSAFWGMAWTLVGPDWGSPLYIAAKPSPQWLSVYRKLGPGIVHALHLMPDTQMLEKNGYRILAGNESAGQAAGARRIWLLTFPRWDLKAGYPPSVLNGLPQQWSDHNHIWVTLYAATPQAPALPREAAR